MRETVRRWAWRGIRVAGGIIAAGALGLGLLTLPPVQAQIAATVADALRAEGVAVERVQVGFPLRLSADTLLISDDGGPVLRIARAEADVALLPLLAGWVVLERATLSDIVLLRRPEDESGSDAPPGLPAWPDLPVGLAVESLSATARIDADVAGTPMQVVLTGSGSLSGQALALTLTVRRTDLPGSSADIALALSRDLSSAALRVSLADAGLTAALTGSPDWVDLTVSADIAYADGFTRADLSAAAPALGHLTGALAGNAFIVSTPETASLAALAGLPVSGPLRIALTPHPAGRNGPAGAQIALDLGGLSSPRALWARLLPGARVTGLVMLDEGGGIALEDLAGTLAGGRVQVEGMARLLPDDALAAELSGRAPLDLFTGAATGEIAARLNVSGPLAQPEARAEAQAEAITVGGLAWRDVSGAVLLSGADLAWRLSGRSAAAEGLAADITARSDLSAPLSLTDVAGTFAGGRLSGALDLAPAVPAGRLQVSNVDLAQMRGLQGPQAEGRAEMSVTLAPADGALRLVAEASAARVLLGGIALSDLRLSAEGPADDLALSGQADVAGFAVQARGRLAEALRIDDARLTRGPDALALAAPVLVPTTGPLRLPALRLTATRDGQAAGTLTLGFEDAAPGQTVSAEVEALALDLFALAPASGRLTGRLAIDGGAGTGRFAGRLADLAPPGGPVGDLPPLAAALEATWQAGRLTATGRVEVPDAAPLTLEVGLPLAPDPAGALPRPDPDAPLSGALSWSGPVARLWPFLGVDDHLLAGALTVTATLTGRLAAPGLSGEARLVEGRYDNAITGTRLTALDVRAESAGPDLTARFAARDGHDGQVSGRVSLRLAAPLATLSGEVTAEGAQLLRRDDAVARVSGTVRLGPDPAGGALQLEGRLLLSEVRGRIPETPGGPVIVVDVHDPLAPPVTAVPATAPTQLPIRLALDIDIPGPAAITGRGLDTLWRGSLQVSGPIDAPQLRGTLRLMQGGLDFAGRRLTLTAGEIVFPGGTGIDPRLSLTAGVRTGGVDAELVLSGRLAAPALTARSQPPLPQDEILARILFGKPAAQLSALEAVQIANSLAALSGNEVLSADSRILEGLRSALGVDVLRVDGLGAGEPSVTAGRYLDDNIFIGVTQGARAGDTRARIEIEISDELSLESEAGVEARSGAGVIWSRDY